MSNFKRKINTSGMTLVEIIVVVSILTLLMAIAIWYFRNQMLKGNDAKRKGDIHRIQVGVEEYEKDNNCYPLPDVVVCDSEGLSPYMSKVPCDPMTNASYYYEHEDTGCPSWYRIYTNLDNLTDADIAGECGPDYSFNYFLSSPNAPNPECTEIGDGGENGGTGEDFYGCFGGSCLPINWDPSRPGPECDPNYGSSSCYSQCTDPDTGQPQNECQSWN
jgi:prepilin-type N-terminal cleavage/methylation domain-containing protein